jgi:hypothetical protein
VGNKRLRIICPESSINFLATHAHDLIEPGGACRGEVEMHVRVTLEPAIVLGLVGVEVVEDHMDSRTRVVSDDIVHEIEEFDTPSAIFVGGSDLTGGDLEGRNASSCRRRRSGASAAHIEPCHQAAGS